MRELIAMKMWLTIKNLKTEKEKRKKAAEIICY